MPLIAVVRVVLVDQVQNPAEVSCVVRNLVVERRQHRFRSGLISLFPVRLCPVAEGVLSTVFNAQRVGLRWQLVRRPGEV